MPWYQSDRARQIIEQGHVGLVFSVGSVNVIDLEFGIAPQSLQVDTGGRADYDCYIPCHFSNGAPALETSSLAVWSAALRSALLRASQCLAS